MRDSAQSFLTVHVPLYVSYIYVTAPRGWASLEHHTEMEFSFFYDTVLWRTGIPVDSLTLPTSHLVTKIKYVGTVDSTSIPVFLLKVTGGPPQVWKVQIYGPLGRAISVSDDLRRQIARGPE